MFLGVDGGGTKTAYALIDGEGRVCARHVGPSVSYLAEGFERAESLLIEGMQALLGMAGTSASAVTFGFVGLPAYGEDTAAVPKLDELPRKLFPSGNYRCGNDMVCSWAGALACRDGISVIAGTGSMAYGEFDGRNARAGGWGELIGDEGSAYWIAREGMGLFSRMSDGRTSRGPLYRMVRERFGITLDLDLCARIYGDEANTRRAFAQFAPVVHDAALAGDEQAADIFRRGADELLQCVLATYRALGVPAGVVLPVSHTGSVLAGAALMLEAFRGAIARAPVPLEYFAPAHAPEIGAALYAARLSGVSLQLAPAGV